MVKIFDEFRVEYEKNLSTKNCRQINFFVEKINFLLLR